MGVLQTPVITAVNVTNANTTVAFFNPRRGQLTITNPLGGATALIAFGFTATTAAYTAAIPAGYYYELPMAGGSIYIGPISGITAAGTAALLVTEVSA